MRIGAHDARDTVLCKAAFSAAWMKGLLDG